MRTTLGYVALLAGWLAQLVPAHATPSGRIAKIAAAAIAQGTARAGMGQAAYLAWCRRDALARGLGDTAWIHEHCRHRWTSAQAVLPLTDSLLSLAPAPGGRPPTLTEVRGTLRQVQWGIRANPFDVDGSGTIRRGPLAGATVVLDGQPNAVRYFDFRGHSGVVQDHPVRHIADALFIRGATVSAIGCGDGPYIDVMRVEMRGRAPILLETYPNFGGGGGTRIHLLADIPGLADLTAGRWVGAEGTQGVVQSWSPGRC